MKKTECFKIQILENSSPEMINFKEMKSRYQIICDRHSRILCEPTTIVADPFLFVCEDTLYLFYEYKRMYKDAVIKMVSTKNLSTWSSPVTVLQEHIHLSYPFVFEDNGDVYMIPETCALRSIQLYKTTNKELTNFSFVKNLIEEDGDYVQSNISFSDSSITKKDDLYYLFTTINRGKVNELKLYFSKYLEGPYCEHPMSPIVNSQKYGRNGGSIIEYQDKLIRVAQDCVNQYGDNIHLLRIDKLTPCEYKESIMQEYVYSQKLKFYEEGGHHLNIVQFNNKQIVSTDAKEYHYFFWNRILHKLGLIRG